MGENPFSLRKEPRRSWWDKATMIICKDEGKGKTKKFLFDHNAEKVLNLQPGTQLGFVIEGSRVFVADITNVNKEEWSFKDDEINTIVKSKYPIDFGGGVKYNFSYFNNAVLYNVLCSEMEINTATNLIYNLRLISDGDLVEYFNDNVREIFNKIGINELYYLDIFDNIKDFSKLNQVRNNYFDSWLGYSKTSAKYYEIDDNNQVKEEPLTTSSYYETLKEAMKNVEVKKVKKEQ